MASVARTVRWGAVGLLAAGCGAADGAPRLPATTQRTAPATMPVLTLVAQSTDESAALRSPASALRVGHHGQVLFLNVPLTEGLLRVMDTTGQRRRRIGAFGEGPGEARMPLPLDITDSTIEAFDLATRRMTVWDTGGRLRETSSPLTQIPQVRTPDGRWVAIEGGTAGWNVSLLDLGQGVGHRISAATDTMFRTMFPATDDPRARPAPVLGLWDGGYVIANGTTYRLALYDWHGALRHLIGRDLPPNLPSDSAVESAMRQWRHAGGRGDEAQVRARIARTPSPWFSAVAPLGLDVQGRIWVVVQQGDSVFADLFAPTGFLGRIPVPCPRFAGRWALAERWIAMACAPDDPTFPGEGIVKLFRIEERTVAVSRVGQ